MQGIENVDFEKGPIANMIAVERYTLDQCDMSHKLIAAIVEIAPIANSKSMIDGEMELMDIRLD